MPELNILFTCAGRRVALLDSFRAAMKELGVTGKLCTTDVTPASAALWKADESILVPAAGRIEYIQVLLETVKKHRIGLVVPLTDLDIRSLARQKEKFHALGCQVMVGSQDAVFNCRDKVRTHECLKQAGLSPLRTMLLPEFLKDPFYPCFVKPVRGSAGIGATLVENKKDLQVSIAMYGDLLIVQDYAPGQEFTIDVYRSRDGQVRAVVPRQRLVVRSGEVEKGVTRKDQDLIDATVKLANSLGDLWGVFCAQCRKLEGDKPRWFEVNPRFGGGVLLSIAAGANLPLYLLQEVLGLPITAKLGEFTDRLLMMRYDDAVFTQVEDPRKLPGYDLPSFR